MRYIGYIHLIILIFIAYITYPPSFAQSIKFGTFTIEDGLSSNIIYNALQDRSGFLWFGTDNGLCRFDGYEFKIFRHNPTDSNSISDNSVWCLFEDDSGFIWIGTKSGDLNKFEPKNEKFKHWNINSSNLEGNSITCIYQDKHGEFWIGTYKLGLYKFSFTKNIFKHWMHDPENPNSLSNNYITSICSDESDNLLIATYNGLNKFIPSSKEKSFIHFFSDSQNPGSLSDNLVWSLSPSVFEPGIIWIGTFNGLTKYDSRTETFTRIYLPNSNNLQFGESISSVVEDSIGNEKYLWVGTYGGLNRINLKNLKIKRYVHATNNLSGLLSNQINFLNRDRSGVVWICSDKGINSFSHKSVKFNLSNNFPGEIEGINQINEQSVEAVTQSIDKTIWIGTKSGLFYLSYYNKHAKIHKISKLRNTHIWSLAAGRKNDLWIGTYGRGLFRMSLNNKKISAVVLNKINYKNSAYNYVKSILIDKIGTVWIGFWGRGLARYNSINGEVKLWYTKPGIADNLSYNDIWVIHQDFYGRIWVGTFGGGLNLYDARNDKFIHWTKGNNKLPGLIGTSINSIYESTLSDSSNNSNETVLWIGTTDGLNKFTIKDNNHSPGFFKDQIVIKSYSKNEGLPDNSIESIIGDQNGNLWIGTNAGISFFNINTDTFSNFSNSDGLTGNEFNSNAVYKTSDELLWFGSASGLNIFNPDNIRQSDFSPSIVLTNFEIFDRPVQIGNNSPINTDISFAKNIALTFDKNVFSFKFSALDFNSPPSIQYAYMMEGFDKNWVYSGSRRFATYTNLYPGTYTFKVKATNSDGIWNTSETSLKIIITPPWWRTLWAYGIYISLIIVGLLSLRRFEKSRIKLRNELKMHEFEVKKQKELDNIKSRFFANLSHEFRTPLMLIKGPLEQLLKKDSGTDMHDKHQMIYRNTEKLHKLIDQLLELSQLETASIPLHARVENLTIILRGIISSFELLAEQNNITLSFYAPGDDIYAWIDRDKFEKIINNLLSNSIKFTPSNREVNIRADPIKFNNKDYFEIIVSDSGIGISQDKIDKIFERFYQVDDSAGKSFGGSGIGLALVKELVDLHKWNISVKSKKNEGTEFSLKIPAGDSYLNDNEKIIFETKKTSFGTELNKGISVNEIESEEVQIVETDQLNNNHGVLIVEDSEDTRNYISSILNTHYSIHLAANGDEGIEAASTKPIELIISDIMMPGMDGIEFCRRIKNSMETSHIPVILLTAKASNESKIEGLETGADDYLIKPFNSRELLTRIKNLLEQRILLKEKFRKEINISPSTVTTTALDNDFLQRAMDTVERNIENPDFDTDIFAKEMFISRSQLHRKLTSITGQTPGEFLRIIRMKKAARLILERKLSITQIAFEVGYNSPSHFTKAFRQQFNCLPSELSEKSLT